MRHAGLAIVLLLALGLAVARADCPSFINTNGLVNGAYKNCSVTVNSVCTATCNSGYTAIPYPYITCLTDPVTGNDTWVPNTVQTCLPVCVGAPSPLSFVTWGDGTNNNCNDSIAQKGVCAGSCAAGYLGTPTITCPGNQRNWIGVLPVGKCVPEAGACVSTPPLNPANAAPFPGTCQDGAANETCTTTCNAGFGTLGGTTVTTTCTTVGQATGWTVPPNCYRVCPGAPPAQTGVTWGNTGNNNCTDSIAPGGLCQGTCDNWVPGSVNITCNSTSKTWSTVTVGACNPNPDACFGPLPYLQDGTWTTTCFGANNTDTCTGTCRPTDTDNSTGTILTWAYGSALGTGNTVTATCNSGNWSSDANCTRVCPDAPPSLTNTTWGNLTTSYCNGTIPFKGQCLGTCTGGSIGGATATCTQVAGSSDLVWSVTGGCFSAGSCVGPLPTLTSGTWAKNCSGQNSCTGTCASTVVKYNATTGVTLTWAYGSTLGTGNTVTANCVAGNWVSNANCTRVCPDAPPSLTNTTWGNLTTSYCNGTMPFGATCAGTCTGGSIGSASTRCTSANDNTTNLAWSTPTGNCGPANSCIGPLPTLTSGTWPKNCTGQFTCTGTCASTVVKTNATGFVQTWAYGSTLGTGNTVTANCVAGNWVSNANCTRVCPDAPPSLTNTTWGNLTTNYCNGTMPFGATCAGTCTGPNIGATSIKCTSASDGSTNLGWSAVTGACGPVGSCLTQPPSFTDGSWSPGCAGKAICTGYCRATYTAPPDPVTGIVQVWAYGNTLGTGSMVMANCVNGNWIRNANCTRVCPTPPAIVTNVTWGNFTNNNCAGSVPLNKKCYGTCSGPTPGNYSVVCTTIQNNLNLGFPTITGSCA